MGQISIQGWWIGVLSYTLCHCVHLLIWRRGPLRHDVKALFRLFILAPFVPLIVISLKCDASLVAVLFTHFAFSANYIAIYPAFQACSPTIEILYQLRNTKTGLTGDELAEALGGKNLLTARLADLEVSGLVKLVNGGLCLTPKGNLLATFFIGYRALLGMPAGGG